MSGIPEISIILGKALEAQAKQAKENAENMAKLIEVQLKQANENWENVVKLMDKLLRLKKDPTTSVKNSNVRGDTTSRPPSASSISEYLLQAKNWNEEKVWKEQSLKWLFYHKEGQYRRCVIAISKNVAVTYYHGTHRQFVENQTTLNIVSVADPIVTVPVMVAKIIPELDLVLLRTTKSEFEFIPHIQEPDTAMDFWVIGFGHYSHDNVVYTKGNVFTNTPYFFKKDGLGMGPFWFGTADTSCGDFGGACINSDGSLIGMNIAKIQLPNHMNTLNDAAVFAPKNVFVSADRMFDHVQLVEPIPPNFKPDFIVNME